MSRAILYSRVSVSSDITDGVSIEVQQAKLRAQAALNDYEVVADLVDNGFSAGSLNRPALQQALQMLRDGTADTLVVYKLDRLTRSVKDFHELLDEFFMNDKNSLVSVQDTINTKTATGRLVLNVMMSVFSWERESIAERVTDGLRHIKSTGGVYCKRLYGYSDVDGQFVPNPDEQRVIEQIMTARDVYDWSFNAIANHLNGNNVPAPCGQKFYHHTVKAIYEREKQKSENLSQNETDNS